MKKLLIFILFVTHIPANSLVTRAPNGMWYGNICITQFGWQEVPWLPVGSMCFAPMWNSYGFIANV